MIVNFSIRSVCDPPVFPSFQFWLDLSFLGLYNIISKRVLIFKPVIAGEKSRFMAIISPEIIDKNVHVNGFVNKPLFPASIIKAQLVTAAFPFHFFPPAFHEPFHLLVVMPTV